MAPLQTEALHGRPGEQRVGCHGDRRYPARRVCYAGKNYTSGPDQTDAAELEQRLNWAGAHLAEALCNATDSRRKAAIRSAG